MTGVPTSVCCSLHSAEALEIKIWTSTGAVFDPNNNNKFSPRLVAAIENGIVPEPGMSRGLLSRSC